MYNEKLKAGAKAMPTVTETLLTRKQVAELFQVSQPTIIRLQAAGKLPAVVLGAGSIRYRKSDVEKLIQDSTAVRTS
jgi:excisionase family DNA binding protein